MDIQAGIESFYVETEHGRFHVEATGTGQPVLFIHGGTASAREWQWVLPDLGAHARCLAIDRLGCGRSDRSRLGYDRTTITQALLACADALGLDRFGVVGQSFGGFWAFSLTFAAPERISRLIAVNTTGPMTDEERASRAQRRPASVLQRPWAEQSESEQEAVIAGTLREIFVDPSRVPASYRDVLRWQMQRADVSQRLGFASIDELSRSRFDAIRCPTLVVYGEGDAMGPAGRGRRLAAAIPGASYAPLPGVGHTCMIEDPAGFVAAVAPFLDATAAGG